MVVSSCMKWMYKKVCMVSGYVEDPTKLSNGGWAQA